MNKDIILVSITFGMIYLKSEINPNYRNTIQIGNKRINFSSICSIDIRKTKSFSIIIYEGVHPEIHVTINGQTYKGIIKGFISWKDCEVIAQPID